MLYSMTAVLNLFGTRGLVCGTQIFRGLGCSRDGSGSNVSDGEQWGEADEVSLTHRLPPAVGPWFLTECKLAWSLAWEG